MKDNNKINIDEVQCEYIFGNPMGTTKERNERLSKQLDKLKAKKGK